MKAAILVSGVVSSVVSIAGTIVALHVVAPAVADAQEGRIRAERVAVVDGNGSERVLVRTAQRDVAGGAGIDVLSSAGTRRITLDLGSETAPGGTADAARLQIRAPEGGVGPQGNLPIAALGTDSGGEGSLLLLRDRQGQIRISLRVDGAGNSSMEMRDADGNVTWRAP